MRVLVCGGRDFDRVTYLHSVLGRIHRERGIDVVIEGNAKGADRIAGFWARKHKIHNLKFTADWRAHGNAAGPIRNQRMLEEGRPDLVVAFPRANGQWGNGTMDMVRRAREAGVEVIGGAP